MRRRGSAKIDKKCLSKTIHVAWPVLCKVELEDAISKLSVILGRINCRGSEDALVLAMESVISAGNEALKNLEQAYGE